MLVSFIQRFGFLAPRTADAPLKSRADRIAKPTAARSAEHSNKAGQITRPPVLKADGHPQATA